MTLDGCSGVDIVSCCRAVLWCVMFVLVSSGCDVVLMSMLRSIYIVGVGLSVAIFPTSVGVVASFGRRRRLEVSQPFLSVGISG